MLCCYHKKSLGIVHILWDKNYVQIMVFNRQYFDLFYDITKPSLNLW